MDRFPLLKHGENVGELLVQKEGRETAFVCRSSLPGDGLWSLWAVGEWGELRLGLPGIQGNCAVLEKRFSDRMVEPIGKVLRGEWRISQQSAAHCWRALQDGCTFRTPWIRNQLCNWPGVLWCVAGTGRMVAVPYDPKRPFPLMPMFCFARLERIHMAVYLVMGLNAEEQPMF